MSWHAVHTWATGDVLTAAHMNSYVRDNTDYIMNTAFKKICNTNNFDTLVNAVEDIGAPETTVEALAITDPGFPSTDYCYVAFCTVPARINVSGDEFRLLARAGGTSSTIIGQSSQRSAASSRIHNFSFVTKRAAVSGGGDTTCYFRALQIAGSGTMDMPMDTNSDVPTGYFGALVFPA